MTSGEISGTNTGRKTFFYTMACAALSITLTDTLTVITRVHDDPALGLIRPLVWEGSSWVCLMAFFWMPWLAYRLAPPCRKTGWRLLLHIPGALLFSLCHVAGFVVLRKLAYLSWGERYVFGPLWQNFTYEFSKDAIGYGLFVLGFAAVARFLRQPASPPAAAPAEPVTATAPVRPQTFDIRDGAKLTRVMLDDILAVTSAGNYAEFKLRDGRLLCTRSSLSALEGELAPLGFVRTHRSWLVNGAAVTQLAPEGSGDYSVTLGEISAPLSRRYPKALTALRGM